MSTVTLKLVVGMMVAGMVLRGGTAFAYTSDRTWDALYSAADKNWSTPANWSADTVPTAVDRATIPQASTASEIQIVNLDGNKTISDLRVESATWQGRWSFTNNPTYTLTVTNDAYFSCTQNGQSYFYPRFVLGGKFTLTRPAEESQISTWVFPATNNQFNGGMDVSYNTLAVTNTGNQFGGELKVGGLIGLPTYTPHVGTVQITGTNNTFANGRFTLNRGGVLTISKASGLSNVTNLLFNGGTLDLGGTPNTIIANTFPVYAGGITVPRGTLSIAAEANLGVGNALTLGSDGSYGTLKGAPQNIANSRVERPITLAGNGGVFDVYPSATYTGYVSSVISGPGELIKRGPYPLYLANGTDTVFRASSYSGGTRVVEEQTLVDGFRSLGTGNVVVDLSAHLRLSNSVSVASGATIQVGRSGLAGTMAPAFLRLYGTGANAAYSLTTNSSGLLALDGMTSGAAINSWLAGNAPGNGTMYLGAGGASATYSGTSLAAGAGNVYRLAGGMNDTYLYLDSNASSGTGNGPLIGSSSVEVGLPYYPTTLWNKGGRVGLQDANTYSGTTTVHNLSLLYATTQSSANASPLGATTGPVVLNGGSLTVDGSSNATGQPITKGDLTFHGSSYVGVKGQTGAVADFTVNSLTRMHRSVLRIDGQSDKLANVERFKVATGAPVPVNGMVAPYFVGYNGSRFLTYDAAVGFTNAVFTATTIASAAATSVVSVTVAEGVAAGKEIYALKAAAVISGAGPLTVGSGGVLLTTASIHTVPLAFGSAEAVIYVPSNTIATLSGTLTGSGGLTKAGAGTLLLKGNNAGLLTGTITVNEGLLKIQAASALGTAANVIVLNGGVLEDNQGTTFDLLNPIHLGPLGGGTRVVYNSMNVKSVVQDLVPGQSGPLRIGISNQPRIFGTNTYTRGTVIEGGNPRIDDNTGDPSVMFGTGPVRIRGTGTLDLFSSIKLNSNARWTLETSQSALLVNRVSGGGVTLGSLEGMGRVVIGSGGTGGTGTSLFTLGGDDTDSDYYGVISEYLGNRCNLLKKGAGTFTIWGDNLHSGWTAVTNSGTLVVNGTLDFSSAVTVYTGATLKGKGFIASPVTVRGGHLEGSLSVGGLTLADSSTFGAELNGTAARIEYDQVQVNGPVTLGVGTVLDLQLGFAPTAGQTFTILNNTSGSSITGAFSSGGRIDLPFGGRTYAFSIDYAGGVGGNDIVLTCLPQGSVLSIR